ncbi:GNAT family N-acetyltransferase, partial [Amycolatopsis vancoresmycina]
MDGERFFCDTGLARRIEHAEARFVAACCDATRARRGGGFSYPLADGVATFAEAGSPFTKVAGLGFAGLPDVSELSGIEDAFAAVGAPVQVELSQLADPAIGAFLTARGYRLESYENVLGRRIERTWFPDDVRACEDDELETWLAEVAGASAVADDQGIPAHEDFPHDLLVNALRDMAGVRRYLAERDGEFAGGASFRVTDGIAQFSGAATVPAHRRRGVQTALLQARL